MSTAIVKFDVSKLHDAARTMAASVPSPLAFLRMDKSGEWTYGAEQDEVPEDQQFAVNPESFQRGVVAWADTSVAGVAAAKLDERMFSVFEDMPDVGEPPRGSRGWEPQQGFQLKGVGKGKLENVELIYRSSSDGGKRAITGLLTEIAQGVADNPGKMPLITVSSSSYKHASFGKIYKPIFTIVKWAPIPASPKEKVAPARRIAKK